LKKNGVREIVTILDLDFKKSGLSIDFTALQRIKSDPEARKESGQLIYPQLELFRPKNLLKYIGNQDNDKFMQNYKDEACEMEDIDKSRRLQQIEKMKDF
jgi:hypothetical protein